MFLAVIFKAGLHILDFLVNHWSVGLRNSKFITFSDRHTSRSKLRSTLSFHRIFSYFVNCLFFQLAIRCWRWFFCKCILFDSRLAIPLSSPKLVLHESRSVSAFCNILRPDIIFILRILNQENTFSISNLERETAALTIAVHILRGRLQVVFRSYSENWAAHLKFKEAETNILTCERNSNYVHLVVCGCVQCLHCAVKGC